MCTLFRKKEIKNTNEIINSIDRLKKSRKPEIYQYYYAFMLELKNGGFSLVNVGHADFFSKNWRFMHKEYKRVQLQIYDWFLNNKNEFEILLERLRFLISSDNFINWANTPWFRFLWTKSLHDSEILSVTFDSHSQQLVITLNSRFAIDYIPFNDPIELCFQTTNFNPQNITELNAKISKFQTILFGITPYFEDNQLRIAIDYNCFLEPKDVFLPPELNFICENLMIKSI
jgi:hypothetical protein